jgi:recombination protein RecR
MNALERLVGNLARLPGLGRKSASRIAYFLLRSDETLVRALAEDLAQLRQTIRACSVCGTYTDVDPCGICTDSQGPASICVVRRHATS